MPAAVSVVVPAWGEPRGLGALLERLEALRHEHGLDLECLVVDDGTEADAIARHPWCRPVRPFDARHPAVTALEAVDRATHPTIVVIDGDLRHPPEAIPNLVLALEAGHDFVFGSRYVRGGSTDDDRGVWRWLADRLATLPVRALTSARDPFSGFFALRRAELERAAPRRPVGRAIGLELLVKCGMENVGEVGIAYRTPPPAPRTGTRRLLLRHLRRLYVHKFGVWSDLVHFLVVGASGAIVNLACLTALVAVDVPEPLAIALAIAVSMFTNFLLNRRFTFDGARDEPFFRQLAGFVAACSLGAGVNFAVATVAHQHLIPDAPVQVCALLGIAAGTAINFVVNRYVVFRAQHVRPR